MENPVKAALNVNTIAKAIVVTFVVFFLMDLAGVTGYLLYPYQALKNKLGKGGG